MRKIKNNIFLALALLPLVAYALSIYRTGTVGQFVPMVTFALGDFGMFFVDIITPLLSEFVSLADSPGIQFFAWIIGYYVTLIFVYLVFSLFTFLVTLFMDKIDSMKGGRR